MGGVRGQLVALKGIEIGVGTVAVLLKGGHDQFHGAVAVQINSPHGKIDVGLGNHGGAQFLELSVGLPDVDGQLVIAEHRDFVFAVAVEIAHGHIHHIFLEALAAQTRTVAGPGALITELRIQVDLLLARLIDHDVRVHLIDRLALARSHKTGPCRHSHAESLAAQRGTQLLHRGSQAAQRPLGCFAPGLAGLVHAVDFNGALIAHDAHRAPHRVIRAVHGIAGFGGGGCPGLRAASLQHAGPVEPGLHGGRHGFGQVGVALRRINRKGQQHKTFRCGRRALGQSQNERQQADRKGQSHGKFHPVLLGVFFSGAAKLQPRPYQRTIRILVPPRNMKAPALRGGRMKDGSISIRPRSANIIAGGNGPTMMLSLKGDVIPPERSAGG